MLDAPLPQTLAAHVEAASCKSATLVYDLRRQLASTPGRWLSIRLETLGALSAFSAAALAVEQGGAASVVGLSLSYALQITQLTNMTVSAAVAAGLWHPLVDSWVIVGTDTQHATMLKTILLQRIQKCYCTQPL